MGGKNLAVTIPEPGRVELVERPFPSIVAGYCVIKTEIAPICLEGTRIWTEHDFEFHDDPEHLGHEGVGTVVEVVPGSNLSVGDRVIVFQGDYCGRCHSCHQAQLLPIDLIGSQGKPSIRRVEGYYPNSQS